MIARLTLPSTLTLAALALSASVALAQTAPPTPPAPDQSNAPASASAPAPVERRAPDGPMGQNGAGPGMHQGMHKGTFNRARSIQKHGNFGPAKGGFRGPEGGGIAEGLRFGPGGMWWKNPMVVQRLSLTADQTKRMDDIFQKSRLELIDLRAKLETQNALLEPMLSETPFDAAKAEAQIDKVAEARANLEKADARMLIGIRGVLTPDQWTKLSTRGGMRPGPADGAGGPPAGGGGHWQRGGGQPPSNLVDPIDLP